MGNNATKEARSSTQPQSQQGSVPPGQTPSPARPGPSQRPSDRAGASGENPHAARRRGSRAELSIFGIGGHHDADPADPNARRETKAEREARKLEKERALRKTERERSIKEEGVDGGFLVTLGTYTGPEDFSKPVVRQLMVC
jgi:hypothetical protein